ncbi:MAG: 2-C-methyl-D-erythritol 4-phosphate cytidylyltransferase [Cyclobacteriaceae bacterium]
MKKIALIVAGGSGTRMGGQVPKQYLPIGGLPILMRTLRVFHEYDSNIKIILVLPLSDFDYWDTLCQTHNFTISHSLVAGGASRFQSVKNGLQSIPGDAGLVAIHDGVRPFVAKEVIRMSFEEAERAGSAIAVIPLKDSIRKVGEYGKSYYQERHHFRLVQTPQTFALPKIKQAYQSAEKSYFTDDATVYEEQGWQVTLIQGNLDNIKITTPDDLEFSTFILERKKFTDP